MDADRSKKVLKKELIEKEDGRYLYLYSWADGEAEESEGKEGADQARKGNS